MNTPNMASALSLLECAEPGRNQYRSSLDMHHGSSIPRLTGKLFSQ